MAERKLANAAYALVLSVVLLSSQIPSLYSLPSSPLREANMCNDAGYRLEDWIQVDGRSSGFVEPIIRRSTAIDKDLNGIQDSLEYMVSTLLGKEEDTVLPVVVTLFNPVLNRDLDWFETLGGHVTRVYQYVTYGWAGVIPATSVSQFARMEGENVCTIEYDAPIEYHLDVSTSLIRARPIVWSTYGYTGSSNHSIAILDTGIDDSHPDIGPYENLNFSKKIIGWYDTTPDNATSPQDFGEHGTHVAGIAAGTGVANALQGSGVIQITFTYELPSKPPGRWVYGYVDYIDVMNPGVINLNCSWSGTNTVLLVLSDPVGNEVKRTSGATKPLTLAYDTTGTSYPTGRYEVFVGNADGPSGTPFSCRETYPYQGRNDGHNLFTGVAPNSKLVGVKVFDNTGAGYLSNLIAGMDWIIQNRFSYHIVVASMSVGLQNGATDSTLDQKADTMVNYGVVTTVSAGNEFTDGYTIGSPGTAAYVITVGATNDQNGLTSYSSNGDSAKNEYGLIKPDVVAPGGSRQIGNLIISADSNDVDYGYSSQNDYSTSDYQQMEGTSMSTPHVAGLAALLIQALGDWNWTLEEALRVKMIVGMTAFETQNGEGTNVPPVNRGGKDSKEGYGRISADAAIEAVTMNYSVGEPASITLGAGPSDKKVWARRLWLSAETRYWFNLTVPVGADYDLYIYNGICDDYGQPVILEKSVNASAGADEALSFVPTHTGNHYVLVRWMSGSGTCSLTSEAATHDVAIINITVQPTFASPGQIIDINVTTQNQGHFTETFNVTVYADSDRAVIGDEILVANQTVANLSSKTTEILYFQWNTTDVSHGNYWISAIASIVSQETDTADNILAGGAFVGGIYPLYNPPNASVLAMLIPLALAVIAVVALGMAAIGFFRLLMSPRRRFPRLHLSSSSWVDT